MQIQLRKLYINIILIISLLFWGIPVAFQKPFKICLLIFLSYLFLLCCKNNLIKKSYILLSVLGVLFICIASYYGTFQSSVLNVALSFFLLPLSLVFRFSLTPDEKKRLRKSCVLLCISMFIQLCIYRSGDGRPSLGYEINNSGAYLFLFFLYSDILKFKFGKFFVIVTSFILLSRLLILSILLFYIVRIFKKNIPINRINYFSILPITYGLFFVFNSIFLMNVKIGENYDTSINRIVKMNDGSNYLRFTINVLMIEGLINDQKFKFGYGDLSSSEYISKYKLMPHNELLDSIAEYGYIFTIYAFLFSGLFYKKVFTKENYEYIIPLIVYSLILWVRYLIVPSIEMFFLLILLNSKIENNEKLIDNSK